jgi:hypothetical protein
MRDRPSTRRGPVSCPPARALLGLAVLLVLAAAPARAEVHGGIEIGAKGVKATTIDVTPGADGPEVKVLKSGIRNTTLVSGLAAAGRFDPAALKDTADAVAAFAEQMRTEGKVPPERIHVVASSGLFAPLARKEQALKENQDALATAVKEACGLAMDFLDVNREIELSIAGIVPDKQEGTALLLDVGSGNTKGGYREPGKGCVTVSIPFGSVSFADLVKKQAGPGSFADAADRLREEKLVPALRKSAEGKPGLLDRERVYLSGGAVWALATLVRPGDRSGYVPLTVDDIAAYRKLVSRDLDAFPQVDLSSIADPATREAARQEIARVKDVFTPRQLLAGAEILEALAAELHFGKGTKVCFARNAPTGWLLAYVRDKAGAPR